MLLLVRNNDNMHYVCHFFHRWGRPGHCVSRAKNPLVANSLTLRPPPPLQAFSTPLAFSRPLLCVLSRVDCWELRLCLRRSLLLQKNGQGYGVIFVVILARSRVLLSDILYSCISSDHYFHVDVRNFLAPLSEVIFLNPPSSLNFPSCILAHSPSW